jgi:hypothetical protein
LPLCLPSRRPDMARLSAHERESLLARVREIHAELERLGDKKLPLGWRAKRLTELANELHTVLHKLHGKG